MTHIDEMQGLAYRLARVRGSSIGSLFFACFGALWLMFGMHALGRFSPAVALCILAAALALVGPAMILLRGVPEQMASDPEREQDGRRFGWVNAGQGLAIFLAVQVAHNLHHPNATVPAIALIVGLHFFALPRSFRVRSNLVTGAVITVGAVLCPLVFHGSTLAGAVALWAGATLWISALWALRTAQTLLRTTRTVNGTPTRVAALQDGSGTSPVLL